MRLDAKKLLTHYRRPVSQRVRNIGVWFRILDCIGKLSVITNGFIIAFTSDIIPRLMYTLFISPDGSLNGYVDHTLAYFKTSEFANGTLPIVSNINETVSVCRYQDYRDPPGSPDEYERNKTYWMMLAARLVFVVIFENFVAIVMIVGKLKFFFKT